MPVRTNYFDFLGHAVKLATVFAIVVRIRLIDDELVLVCD